MMSRRTVLLLALLAIVVGAWAISLRPIDASEERISAVCRDPDIQPPAISRRPDWPTHADGFIAHGGGAIDGKTYTNSLEALVSSIERGYRMIELDLLVTSDGFIVAAHDWTSFRQRTGHPPEATADQPMSLAEFQSKKIDGRYTPLSEEIIRSMFMKHPNLILVTDKIRDFPRLVRAFPFQERIIVEVFSRREIALAKAAGVVNAMLSVGDVESSLGLVLEQPVHLVALSIGELRRCPGAVRQIVESGRRVFAFTSDDASLMARYFGSHVSAIYTDGWHVAHGRCEGTTCPDDNRKLPGVR